MQYMCPFWSLRSQLKFRKSLFARHRGHPRHRRRPASDQGISDLALTVPPPAPAGPAPGGPGNGSGPAAWLWIFELRYEAEAGAERSRVCIEYANYALHTRYVRIVSAADPAAPSSRPVLKLYGDT